MVDKSKVRRAFNLYMKNDYWREYYETAPSETCKAYIMLDFADSAYNDPEINQARRAMYDVLGLEDWRHLRKYAGNNPFRGRCSSMIAKLEQESASRDQRHAPEAVI